MIFIMGLVFYTMIDIIGKNLITAKYNNKTDNRIIAEIKCSAKEISDKK